MPCSADTPITVITPNLNSGSKLLLSCQSVAQDELEVEHLIMDGGSTDHSVDAVRRANLPHVRIHSEPDNGVYDALNRAVGLATGRYLYCLGAGDVLLPGALRHVAQQLPVDNATLLYGSVLIQGTEYGQRFSARRLLRDNLCHQAAFYGRDVFATCGQYDLRYPVLADYEFNMRCFGSTAVTKQYVPLLVAEYEGGGLSDRQVDHAFLRDKASLIRKHFGVAMWAEYHARRRISLWRHPPAAPDKARAT